MTDPSKSGTLLSIGVNPRQSTDKVAIDTLKAVYRLTQTTPLSQLGMMGSYRHLGELGFDDQRLRLLKNTSPKELEGQITAFGRDSKSLGLDPATAQQWQRLNTQLERAGIQIERTFIRGLTPLTPAFERLSGAFSKLLGGVFKSLENTGAIDKLATWLNDVSTQISSKPFAKDIGDLIGTIGTVGRAFVSLAEDLPSLVDTVHFIAHPVDSTESWFSKMWNTPDRLGKYAMIGDKQGYAKELQDLGASRDLPKGFLPFIWQRSGMSFNPADTSGRKGALQLPGDVLARYGVSDPSNTYQETMGALAYSSDLQGAYGGDTEKMLAAYLVGGQNKLNAIINAHPKDWRQNLPKDVQSYVSDWDKALKQSTPARPSADTAPAKDVAASSAARISMNTKASRVKIDIYNNTGGSAVAAASQLA
jgi:hypothetical protein